MTDEGLIDKFELICADIYDHNFDLENKVDCVVLCNTVCTFISNFDMLTSLLSKCKKLIKDGGSIFVSDFSYFDIPKEDNFWAGMATELFQESKEPSEFETFKFIMSNSPDTFYTIFNIPSETMFRAAKVSGMKEINYCKAEADPNYKDDPVFKRYLSTATDYIMVMHWKLDSIIYS